MFQIFTFENKVVWVTGSSSGIGRAIALGFAENGANVIVHGNKNITEAEKTLMEVKEKGVQGFLVTGDVSDRVQVDRMVSEIETNIGKIDILINNAGTMVQRGKIEALDPVVWDKIIATNLNSVFHVTQTVLPLMKKQGQGQIINTTSVAARNGGGGGAVAYSAAKAGVSTFTRGLAKELVPYNIRVNGIAPGLIATSFHERYSSPEMFQAMAKSVPLGREGRPDEIVGAALYLASDYASYVTGEIIEINGGLLMD